MKKFKRAFTIVELVIVIAVIAILAAVLIPTFSSIIRKANVSNDTQLVRNLNTALVVDKAINGEHKTMQSALDAAFDAGYDLSKINARANQNEILWDSVNDVFCYLSVENGVGAIEYIPNSIEETESLQAGDYRLWRIVKKTDEINPNSGYLTGYSVYLADDFVVTDGSVAINGKGFDAGNNTGVTSVSYTNTGENGRDVVIRTNSANTTLTIDAASDTVKHYGAVGSLNIIAVAGSSYHEFGQVAFAEIANGRIVLESESTVEHIHLNTSEVNNETVFNNITVAKASDVEMPEFSRDPIEIDEEKGTLVVALQAGTEEITESTELDYVWLTAVGIYEQVTVSTSDSDAGTTYATSDSVNAEKKETAQQIANNISVSVGGDTYTVKAEKTTTGWKYVLVDEENNESSTYTITETPVVTVSTTTNEETSTTTTTTTVEVNVVDTNDQPVTPTTAIENGMTTEEKNDFQETLVENAVDSEIVENNENYIARIGNTFYEDIHKAFEALQAGETLRLLKDYRVEQDSIIHVKTSYNEADTAFGNLSADKIFDGCNHTIEFADGVSAYLFGDMNGTIQNFKVLNSTKSIARISKTDASNDPITFKNIEVYGNMNVDGNTGAFVVYITGQNGEFRFIDCVNNCNMTGIGTSKDYNAAFIGYFWGIYGCEVYLTRCINNADIVCGAAAFIGGNPWLNDANKTTPRVYLTDCENRGKIQRTYTGADSFAQNILYGAPQGWLNFSTIIDGRTYSPSDIVNGLVPDTAIRGNKLIIGPVNSTLSLTRNNDGTFSFHGLDGAAKYEVSVGLYVRTVSGTYRYYAKQVINHIENQMDYDANIKDLQFVDYDWLHDHDGAIVSISQWNQEVNVVIYNEQQYFLVPEAYKINGGVTSGQMYTVVAYDSNNNLLASATLEN